VARVTPTDRKAEILEAAQELIQTQGYTGFSYQDLADRLGLAKPTLHHHFPTKEALGLALVASYEGMLTEMKAGIAALSDLPSEQLRAFLRLGDEQAQQEHAICPGGALHSNFETFPESMQLATRQLSEGMHAWMAELLQRGRAAGDLHFEGTPEDQAWWLISALMGGRQTARTHGPEIWQAISRQVESTLLGSS
jgi:TetR/AcrR family transcriptional repressor of nem operon